LVINTPQGSGARQDGYEIRTAAVVADIPCITTIPGAAAAVMGIEALIRGEMEVRPLQELHASLRRGRLPVIYGRSACFDLDPLIA
jgi:carbamoyl-phosphate synthase large subunit